MHNLRIWSLSIGKIAVSVHLEITTRAYAQEILKETTMMLRDQYDAREITIQIEGYNPNRHDCYRCIPPS